MGLTLVVSVAVFGILLLILNNSLKDKPEQIPLKIFIYFFVVFSFIILGKAGIDDQTVCQPVVNYTVDNSTDNSTSFYFDRYCYERDESTGQTFFRLVMWFVIIFYLYSFIIYMGKMYQVVLKWWGGRR